MCDNCTIMFWAALYGGQKLANSEFSVCVSKAIAQRGFEKMMCPIITCSEAIVGFKNSEQCGLESRCSGKYQPKVSLMYKTTYTVL